MQINGLTVLFVLSGLLLLVIVYFIFIYNSLVSLKHGVSQSWSNIDVLLKQRHDELPKLVETCKQYMQHERETLQRVTEARSGVAAARQSGDVKAVGKAETALRAGLGNLFATVEAYPELKADSSFAALFKRISGLENAIADRREFYNESVNLLNVRIEQFPDLIIARRYNFKAADLLEFEEEELTDVDMKSLFS